MTAIILIGLSGTVFPAQSVIKPTTVVGFNNLGDSSDDKINMIITKSLISFLSKIKDAVITPYHLVENAAVNNGYWKKKTVDKDAALTIAQGFESKQMIVGDYKVDKNAKTIQIHVYVYDVVTGDLKLTRSYSGSSGVGLFDTVDAMSKNIAGLLSSTEISTGILEVRIAEGKKGYRLYLNGKSASVLSLGSGYSEKMLANEDIEVVLRQTNDDKEVYQNVCRLQGGTNLKIEYRPMGNAVVKNMNRDGVLYLDGQKVRELNREKTVTLSRVEVSRPHLAELRTDNGAFRKEFTVEEGESSIVIFEQGMALSDVVDYSKSAPLLNLALPGLAQYQAHDWVMGTLFLVLGLAGPAMITTAEISFMDSYSKYEKATTPEDARNYYNVSEMWRNISIGGIAVWGGAVLFSVLHAYWKTGETENNNDIGVVWNPENGGFCFAFTGYF